MSSDAGESVNLARMRQGRRSSVVLNAPKPTNIRMSSQEFPKTVTDEAVLALRLAAAKADAGLLSRNKKTIRNVAMFLFNKKSSGDMSADLGSLNSSAPESPKVGSASAMDQSASSFSLASVDEEKAPSGRFSLSSRVADIPSPVRSTNSSPAESDSDLDTLASYDGKNKSGSPQNIALPALPSLPPLPRRFSTEISREPQKNIRRSATSGGIFSLGELSDGGSGVGSSQSMNSADLSLRQDNSVNSVSTLDESVSRAPNIGLSRTDSFVSRDAQNREKMYVERDAFFPARTLNAYHILYHQPEANRFVAIHQFISIVLFHPSKARTTHQPSAL